MFKHNINTQSFGDMHQGSTAVIDYLKVLSGRSRIAFTKWAKTNSAKTLEGSAVTLTLICKCEVFYETVAIVDLRHHQRTQQPYSLKRTTMWNVEESLEALHDDDGETRMCQRQPLIYFQFVKIILVDLHHNRRLRCYDADDGETRRCQAQPHIIPKIPNSFQNHNYINNYSDTTHEHGAVPPLAKLSSSVVSSHTVRTWPYWPKVIGYSRGSNVERVSYAHVKHVKLSVSQYYVSCPMGMHTHTWTRSDTIVRRSHLRFSQ